MRTLLDLLAPPACWNCRESVRGGPLCAVCTGVLPWLDQPRVRGIGALEAAWAPLAFAGPARALVHALKFHGAAAIAATMALQITDGVPPPLFAPGWALVAVPAHPGRRRRRGFDPAELLAQALARQTGLALEPCLSRQGGSSDHQRGLDRRARLAGEHLRIDARSAAPARCLLIDDVRTTGATAQACATALRAAGARRVIAVAYANVP